MFVFFFASESFNQDIGKWDVSKVTDMSRTFQSAKSFNQDIGNWDVSRVKSFENMFFKCDKFKQDLSNWNLKASSNIQQIINYLNSYSTKKIVISEEKKLKVEERGNKEIELKIDDIKIKTTLGKFEEVINGDDGYVVYDYDDDYNIELSDSLEEVCMFLNSITDEKLVITAEYYANDEKLGEIKIEEVSYLNCECPEKLKKYYNGDIFINYCGEKLDRKSDSYKKIDFDNIWEDAEITNSGVVIEKFND